MVMIEAWPIIISRPVRLKLNSLFGKVKKNLYILVFRYFPQQVTENVSIHNSMSMSI